MRNYDSASLLNGPATIIKSLPKEAGLCEAKGCMFKELVSVNLTDAFLKQNLNDGFQLKISSKAGISTVVYVPTQYIKGYLKAVDGKNY